MKTVSARAGHSKASTTSDFYSHFIKNSDIHAKKYLIKFLNKLLLFVTNLKDFML